MATEILNTELSYLWEPFESGGCHLTFAQHVAERLEASRCSHWGPAVYKWEGLVAAGPHKGRLGILIGETADLRHRIKQYVSGTQERGNQLWRETFLRLGDVRLYILKLQRFTATTGSAPRDLPSSELLESANGRLVLEQLLVMQARAASVDSGAWIVNARQ